MTVVQTSEVRADIQYKFKEPFIVPFVNLFLERNEKP
jgi:uncharacterized protein (DUF1919 family)